MKNQRRMEMEGTPNERHSGRCERTVGGIKGRSVRRSSVRSSVRSFCEEFMGT